MNWKDDCDGGSEACARVGKYRIERCEAPGGHLWYRITYRIAQDDIPVSSTRTLSAAKQVAETDDFCMIEEAAMARRSRWRQLKAKAEQEKSE
jgi:hypothetical protein